MKNINGNKNPNYKHGMKGSRLYSIYHNMKTRCYNKNSLSFHNYGGRGVKVCEEWLNNFISFYMWSIDNGYDNYLTLDRINNDGNYEPNNCRWVTVRKQSLNRRDNHYVTINKTTKTLIEWCEYYNINYRTVQDRIRRGWNEYDALTKKVETKFRRKNEVHII